MKVDFTPKEALYNKIYIGRLMWIDDEQKVIEYVKIMSNSPILLVNFTDGTSTEMNENKSYTFIVNNKLHWKKSNKKKNKPSISNI